MQKIEQTLDSREVAEMIEKEHKYLIRDIKKYTMILTGAKISPVDFWNESTYTDAKGEQRFCYKITKKGCEFIGHKVKGEKGVIFTARYINRFHEMQDIITEDIITEQKKEIKPDRPWFVRKFRGNYIVLERDFIQITGVDITKHKAFYRMEYFEVKDCNSWGWHTVIDKKKFKEEYGFDYGDDETMNYFYPSGVRKALDILTRDRTIHMNEGADKMFLDGINALYRAAGKTLDTHKENVMMTTVVEPKKLPEQINITITLGDTPKIALR